MTPGDVYITSRGMLWRYMGTDAKGFLIFRLGEDGLGRQEKHIRLPGRWKRLEPAERLAPRIEPQKPLWDRGIMKEG